MNKINFSILILIIIGMAIFLATTITQKSSEFNGTIYYSNRTLYFIDTDVIQIKGIIYQFNGTHSTELNTTRYYRNFNDTLYIDFCNQESYYECENQCKRLPGKVCKALESKSEMLDFSRNNCYYYYAQQGEGDPCSHCVIKCGTF